MTNFRDDVLMEEKMGFPFNVLSKGLRSADSALYGRRAKNEMKVDMQEHETGYTVDIDLPGCKKEQISVEIANGFLTVSAEKSLDREETDSSGRVIRRERYTGEMRRSFHIGDTISEDGIRARYANGVLHLDLPKSQENALPEAKRIPIEE